ncbi:MAG: NeuD/PglB/VioB family sugar acetyltransferase [Idiomarina sp.]|nr:NeuD/PglB/VioB family sugar acetyltransferase [Idiomarina sp.]
MLIVGAGGHGRSVAEAALSSGEWSEIHFADDKCAELKSVNNFPLAGPLKSYLTIGHQYDGIVVAIGNNEVRSRFALKCLEHNLPLTAVIHRRAFVSPFAEIGAGTTIMAGVTIGDSAKVGIACIINSNSCVDHDCCISDFVHLGVGVCLAGGVKVGKSAVLYAGTCAGYHVNVPATSTWGPGAVLTHTEMHEITSPTMLGAEFSSPLTR